MLNLKFNEDTSFIYASSSLNFAFMDCIFELKILNCFPCFLANELNLSKS